jgi:streptogramin lyase
MSRRLRARFRPSVEALSCRCLLAVTVSELAIPSHWGAVVAGLDSAIWFPQDDGRLGRMSASGELSSFVVGAQPAEGLAVTSNGDIWFTTNDYQIGRFRPEGDAILIDIPHNASSAAPWRLAAGPDGNLWFTELTGNKIGRMTPEGSVTEFTIPTDRSLPAGICAGPDGNVWFVESNTNAIGRITTSGQITEFPGPSRRQHHSTGAVIPRRTAALRWQREKPEAHRVSAQLQWSARPRLGEHNQPLSPHAAGTDEAVGPESDQDQEHQG